MGKKIILSEAQFKNYMRRLLKEDTAGSNASMTYRSLSERLQRYASYVADMGQQYINLYDFILSYLRNYGVVVNGVQENSDEYTGNPYIIMNVDLSGVQVQGVNSEDYGSVDEWFNDVVGYDMKDEVIGGTSLKKYFNGLDVDYGDGVLKIMPEPIDGLSSEHILRFLGEV